MAKMKLTILIWEEDGVYVSRCPEIEVASCGDTPPEALDNIREAIDLYFTNARALGISCELEPILTSPHKFTSVIEVEG